MRMIAAIGLGLMVLAQPATAAPPPPHPSAAPDGYRISPGDQLEIYVWGDERLQRSLNVLPDGTFAFPLAGTIAAAGRSPVDIEAELSKLLAGQYKGVPPQVTVSVKVPSGMQVSVIGKVRSPGTYSPTRYVNVLGALALAGGPSDFADVGNIIVLRRNGNSVEVIHAHLTNILKGRPAAEDLAAGGVPQLLAGDTVVVP